jgi:hypothetical protein
MPYSFLNCVNVMVFISQLRRLFHIIFFPRQQRVGCDDDFSSLAPLVTDVLQGSPILPLCFSLFIDDMTDVLEFSNSQLAEGFALRVYSGGER